MMQTRSQNNLEEKPNVILITCDDVNYELLLSNLDNLPNLKKVTDNAVTFTNAFSVGPATVFSLPAIIGSIYPYHFGIGIERGIETISLALKREGYNTAFINEANAFLTPFFGYGEGIDYQELFLSLSHSTWDRKSEDTLLKREETKKDKKNYLLRMYGKLLKYKLGTILADILRGCYQVYCFLNLSLSRHFQNLQEREKLYDRFRGEITRFINYDFKSPQFLWIHTIINHLPYLPPEGTRFTPNTVNRLNYRGLSGLVTVKTAKKLKGLYIESLKTLDGFIGQIINQLEEKSLLRDSIIILTSDHGEEFMEERYFGHNVRSSSDRLLRVPLAFYSPHKFTGRNISVPVSTIDILPTITSLLNIPIPGTARGSSLKGLIFDDVSSSEEEAFPQRPLFSEAWVTRGNLDRRPGNKSDTSILTVRRGEYKLKVIMTQTLKPVKLELYNWHQRKYLGISGKEQILEELLYLLFKHLYEEGNFCRQVLKSNEVGRISHIAKNLKSITRKSMSGKRNLE